MTTPNIEELIAVLEATNQFHDNADICTADVIAALQSQAARIKELEADRETALAPLQIALDEVSRLRAQLAEIDATEPSMIYHGRCVIDCGDSGHQDVTMLKMIARETKLFTRPIPAQIIGLQDVHDAVTADPTLADCAQNVMELVEALEKLARLGNGEHYGNSDGNMIARMALSRYKGAK